MQPLLLAATQPAQTAVIKVCLSLYYREQCLQLALSCTTLCKTIAHAGDAGPALAGDDDRTDLLKNQTSLQDSVFGVSFCLPLLSCMQS